MTLNSFISGVFTSFIFLGLFTVFLESAEAQEKVVVVSCEESCSSGGASGGSNPLIVERLRQETYEMRKQKAEAIKIKEERKNTEGQNSISYTPKPTVMPYPEDFVTLGDLQKKEENSKEKTVTVSSAKNLKERSAKELEKAKGNGCITQFSDIEDSTHKDSITTLDCMNIISGKEKGTFSPDDGITRKEAIKIATLVAGKEPTPNRQSPFEDIENTDWSTPYVVTAVEEKVITNDSKTLKGNKEISEEEALALYCNAAGVHVSTPQETFPFYESYIMGKTAEVYIPEYTPVANDTEKMTRAEFVELSTIVMQALKEANTEYTPIQELDSPQYSVSQEYRTDPKVLFPEFFRRDDEE